MDQVGRISSFKIVLAPGVLMNLRSKVEVASEFVRFLSTNRKYWLIPFFLVLVVFALFIALAHSGGAITPFVYVLF